MPKPRNLTSVAYHEEIFNPPMAHPKDSVGNTAPGLEIDERTIEKYAFPGLVLEFQRSDWNNPPHLPVIRTIDERKTVPLGRVKKDSKKKNNKKKDGEEKNQKTIVTFPVDSPHEYLFLYALKYLNPLRPQDYRFYDFSNDAVHRGWSDRGSARALDCWNAIRNLPRSGNRPIALLIGIGGLQQGPHWPEAIQIFEDLTADSKTQRFPEETEGVCPLIWAIVVLKMQPLEDSGTGLIFPDVPPGDLQSTMCTPWQQDFRDCYCYYWASNRPDMVSGEGPEERNLNFLRKRKPVWDKAPIPLQSWGARTSADKIKQGQAIWTHVETINDWEKLPVVLDDREVLTPRRQVVEKLQVLASIEHALSIEYLYAYHSVVPDFEWNGEPLGEQARNVLIEIAQDEMSHLRWVNETLRLLEERCIIDRAENYGPNFDWRNFQLNPLTRDTLDWFIRIEKPSQRVARHSENNDKPIQRFDVPAQLEGLYIGVLRIIEQNPNCFGNEECVETIRGMIKNIVDEGGDHYRRFADLQQRLVGYRDREEYLRPVSEEAPSDGVLLALQISDLCYHALLIKLGRMFRRGDYEDGTRLQQLVDHMHAMDDLNERLAAIGHPASFNMPSDEVLTVSWDPWFRYLKFMIETTTRTLGETSIADAMLRSVADAALDSAARLMPGSFLPDF